MTVGPFLYKLFHVSNIEHTVNLCKAIHTRFRFGCAHARIFIYSMNTGQKPILPSTINSSSIGAKSQRDCMHGRMVDHELSENGAKTGRFICSECRAVIRKEKKSRNPE